MMTMWQEDGMLPKASNGVHVDLQEELEASHAEVARMKQQIAATTAAVVTARGSNASQIRYSGPDEAEHPEEDTLIR